MVFRKLKVVLGAVGKISSVIDGGEIPKGIFADMKFADRGEA
jgi:hypothetical protein